MKNFHIRIFFTNFKFLKHSFIIMPDISLETTETENAKHSEGCQKDKV
jgi:hypothetical protein